MIEKKRRPGGQDSEGCGADKVEEMVVMCRSLRRVSAWMDKSGAKGGYYVLWLGQRTPKYFEIAAPLITF